MSTILPSLPGLTVAPNATDREKLSAVAKQFEAVFVRQMLAAARKTDFGGDDLFGSQAMDTFRQMQDEQFADTAVQSGAFGLAKILEQQMARFLPAAATAGTTGTPAAPAGGGT